MALDQFNLRALLLKKETTEGTDEVPTGAANAIQLINGAGAIETDQLEREIDLPYFGGRPAVRISKRMTYSGTVELIGAAAAANAAPIGPLLEIAGHAETLDPVTNMDAIYNPISTGIPSASTYWYQGGEVQKGVGSRAQINSITMAINDFPKADIQGIANPTANDEAALPTVDLTAFQAPPAIITENATLTIDGTTIDGISVELSMNANVPLIEHTEGRFTRLTARAPTGTVRIYRPLRSAIDIRSIIESGAQVPLVFSVNTGGGLSVDLTMAQCQLFDPTFSDEEGLVVWDLPFRALPSSAGHDEYLLRFYGAA